MENQPISTDTLLQVIGIKEVEIHMLKQQIQTLLNNQGAKSVPPKDKVTEKKP